MFPFKLRYRAKYTAKQYIHSRAITAKPRHYLPKRFRLQLLPDGDSRHRHYCCTIIVASGIWDVQFSVAYFGKDYRTLPNFHSLNLPNYVLPNSVRLENMQVIL